MTGAQGDALLVLVQEVSNQIIILQVAVSLIILAAFASLIYSWRK